MSTSLNRSKVTGPNRLVSRHEEYLISKSLANKVKHVKSTINSGNTAFERVIITRQKRDTQRPPQLKLKSPERFADIDAVYKDYKLQPDSRDGQSKYTTIKTAEPYVSRLPKEFISPTMRKKENLPTSGRVGQSSTTNCYANFTEHLGLVKEREVVSSNFHTRGVGSVGKDSLIGNKFHKNGNAVSMLKSQLHEKNNEIEILKSELKDWWHEDYKSNGEVSLKENEVENLERKNSIRHPSAERDKLRESKSAKAVTMGKILTIGPNVRKNSDIKYKKDRSIDSIDVKRVYDLSTKPVHYEESLKILEKIEEYERGRKKLEPLNIKDIKNAKKEPERRPSSVKNKTAIFTGDSFKIRFSSRMEKGSIKINTRYKSDDADVIDEALEQEKEEVVPEMKSPEIEVTAKKDSTPQKPPKKDRYNNNTTYDYEDIEEDIDRYDDDDGSPNRCIENESPQIIATSKTLILQSRVMGSRANEYGFQ